MSARACDGCKHCVRVDDRAHCSRPGTDGDGGPLHALLDEIDAAVAEAA